MAGTFELQRPASSRQPGLIIMCLQEIFYELIDTERQYVLDLKQLITLFLRPVVDWSAPSPPPSSYGP